MWLSETLVAFARWCLCGCETAIAFAGTGRASNETDIAFAGEKWVFLACFSLVLVLSVSMGVVQGRAVVMAVSCWPVLVGAVVSSVSTPPRRRLLWAIKFALRGLVVGVCAKKFALRGHNGPKLVFSGVMGELFRGWGVGGGVTGELFRACQPATATGHGRHCQPAPRPGLAGPPVPFTSVTVGVLQH